MSHKYPSYFILFCSVLSLHMPSVDVITDVNPLQISSFFLVIKPMETGKPWLSSFQISYIYAAFVFVRFRLFIAFL